MHPNGSLFLRPGHARGRPSLPERISIIGTIGSTIGNN
jgi:hypothetical protein